MKNKTVRILPVIIIILAVAAAAIYVIKISPYKEPASQVAEGQAAAAAPQEQKPAYDYAPGKRPDYGLPNNTFASLPPIPQDFWNVKQKFYSGQIIDFVDMKEQYYKQPEFYPTFENNLEFIRNPQGGTIYAFGLGAYPGDIGAEAPPDSYFTVATFFYSSWVVETHQGVKLEVVYPEKADILTPDLTHVNFTVKQNPSEAGKYFNVIVDPGIFVLGPSAPAFDYSWALKVKLNVTINPGTPKGTYVIGLEPVIPPPEYSDQWSKQYDKYSDTAGLRVGRPPFQLVVFVT